MVPEREHPRGCGADDAAGPETGACGGASPRVRGRHEREDERHPLPGSIPARAGPTANVVSRGVPGREHPRACGADRTGGGSSSTVQGASPRVRGRRPCGAANSGRGRSIPARAGPTSTPSSSCGSQAEHPRACGADIRTLACGGLAKGASPRVRGRRYGAARTSPDQRSIPARAGPTGLTASAAPAPREHPRACGADTC